MFELKPLSKDAIAGALAKAERYRLLNEASEAESICLDVLNIDPANQDALVTLLLALTDQGRPGYDPNMAGLVAGLGIPVFTCTPDIFPDMMAAALRRDDIATWAAGADIKVIRANEVQEGHA